jgi:hypothetical protein
MKPSRVYLDTNAFRYFGNAFEKTQLATDIRDKILISPLSAFEVFAQLGDEDETKADLVLRQIHGLTLCCKCSGLRSLSKMMTSGKECSNLSM